MPVCTALIVLLSLLAPAPVCGPDPGEPARRALLLELNLARLRAGRPVVQAHPAVCALARDRALEIAAQGTTETAAATLNDMSRRLYRRGYAPHKWIESTLIGGRERGAFEQLCGLRAEWCEDAVGGDFEHAGVGVAERDGRHVRSLVLAQSKRTFELGRAAPLADLERVRASALAAVNLARRDNGRRPVEASPLLDAAAQRHAEDMLRRAYYDHRSPEGTTPGERARAAGQLAARRVSENIAKGLFTPDEVVRRWLDSPGHRRNILDPKAAVTGFGVAFGEGDDGVEVVWVQMFAGS